MARRGRHCKWQGRSGPQLVTEVTVLMCLQVFCVCRPVGKAGETELQQSQAPAGTRCRHGWTNRHRRMHGILTHVQLLWRLSTGTGLQECCALYLFWLLTPTCLHCPVPRLPRESLQTGPKLSCRHVEVTMLCEVAWVSANETQLTCVGATGLSMPPRCVGWRGRLRSTCTCIDPRATVMAVQAHACRHVDVTMLCEVVWASANLTQLTCSGNTGILMPPRCVGWLGRLRGG